MLRQFSLKKNKEFHFVYRAGKSAGSSSIVLVYAKSRHQSIRVGFSVSKKVGNAVTRNKVKRRMRDAFFRQLSEIKPGYSLVFVAKPALATQSFEQLYKNMRHTLIRANLLLTTPENK